MEKEGEKSEFQQRERQGKKVSCFIFRVQEKKNREEVRREEGRQGLEGEGKRKKGRRKKKGKQGSGNGARANLSLSICFSSLTADD